MGHAERPRRPTANPFGEEQSRDRSKFGQHRPHVGFGCPKLVELRRSLGIVGPMLTGIGPNSIKLGHRPSGRIIGQTTNACEPHHDGHHSLECAAARWCARAGARAIGRAGSVRLRIPPQPCQLRGQTPLRVLRGRAKHRRCRRVAMGRTGMRTLATRLRSEILLVPPWIQSACFAGLLLMCCGVAAPINASGLCRPPPARTHWGLAARGG